MNKYLLLSIGLLLLAKTKKTSDDDDDIPSTPSSSGSTTTTTGVLPQFSDMKMSRNFRNNNPGNIKINPANKWLGKVPENQNSDGTFEQFYQLKYGLRAMIKLLRNKITAGFNTPRKLITDYTTGEDPTAYINNFIKFGINPDSPITSSDKDSIFNWVKSMVFFESKAGTATITRSQFDEAWALI